MESFNDSTVDEVKNYLGTLKQLAHEARGEGSRTRNQKKQQLIEELGGVASFSSFRDAYENAQLTDILLNNKALDKIEQKGSHLIRRYHPVYMESDSRLGRAHLYAAHKHIGNWKIATLWFNVIVIWFSCLILYLTLYFDTLRKVLEYFGRIQFAKKPKDR